MRRSIVYRLLQFIPVVFGVTLLTFIVMQLAPGDPIDVRMSAAGITADPDTVRAMQESMGLNDPIFVQYGRWVWHFLQGDLGQSYITDLPVSDELLEALPYTLKMSGLSMVLTLMISVPIGIMLATFRNSALDYGVRGITFILNSIPSFIIGIFLLYVFAFRLHLIPVLATKQMIGMILPSLTLALVMSSRYIRQVRAATLDELNRPYVVGLRARGLTEKTILFRNVLKNIMITIITLTALSFGFLLGGTVVVETVFNWPGIGYVMMEAISHRDYPIIQGLVVWMSIAFLVINLLSDIAYTWFNPRIKDI